MLRSTLVIAVAVALCGTAAAQDAAPSRPELAIWAGYGESNNIARTVDAERGSYSSVGVLLGIDHASDRLVGGIDSDLEFRRYSQEEVDRETVGTLNAFADVYMVVERLRWSFRENYDQGRTDPFQPLGPENRETINAFSTGPQLDLPLGQRSSLEIGSELSARRYQESTNVDSDALTHNLALLRQVNPTNQLGIVATSNETEYVDTVAPTYTIESLSLRYVKDLVGGGLTVEYGTNEVGAGDLATDEPRFNLDWTRSIGTRSSLNVTAAREFTDSGQAVAEGESIGDVLLSSSPFELKRVGIAYTLAGARTQVTLAGDLSENNYVGDTTLDNESLTKRISFRHSVSAQLSFGLVLDSIERDYGASLAQEPDQDNNASAWVDRWIGRRYSLSFSASRYERRGTQPLDEQRYELRFSYTPTGSGPAALQSVGR